MPWPRAGARAVRRSITLNSAELDEARAIARRAQRGADGRYHHFAHALYRELVRRARTVGPPGAMNLAQINFGSYKEYGDLTNRFYNINLAGGAMLDIGVYALSDRPPVYGQRAHRGCIAGNTLPHTGVDTDQRFCYTVTRSGQLGVF